MLCCVFSFIILELKNELLLNMSNLYPSLKTGQLNNFSNINSSQQKIKCSQCNTLSTFHICHCCSVARCVSCSKVHLHEWLTLHKPNVSRFSEMNNTCKDNVKHLETVLTQIEMEHQRVLTAINDEFAAKKDEIYNKLVENRDVSKKIETYLEDVFKRTNQTVTEPTVTAELYVLVSTHLSPPKIDNPKIETYSHRDRKIEFKLPSCQEVSFVGINIDRSEISPPANSSSSSTARNYNSEADLTEAEDDPPSKTNKLKKVLRNIRTHASMRKTK